MSGLTYSQACFCACSMVAGSMSNRVSLVANFMFALRLFKFRYPLFASRPSFIGLSGCGNFEGATFRHFFVGNVIAVERLTVEFHGLNIDIFLSKIANRNPKSI